jgi:hypothetical protein
LPKATTATVTWGEPTCSDPSGCSITRVAPIHFAKGAEVSETPTPVPVKYVAKDGEGNTKSCEFTVQVKVTTCKSVKIPTNGVKTCERDPPIYGDTCKFTCKDGYYFEATTEKERSYDCANDGTVNAGQQLTCIKLVCPKLDVPMTTTMQCTDDNLYQSVCTFKCDDGFGPRTDGKYSTRCQEDETWTDQPSTCVDITPPILHNCPPTEIIAYLEKNEDFVTVTWIEPTVTDNVDSSVDVTRDGPAPGSKFYMDVGSAYTVTYTAEDIEGNVGYLNDTHDVCSVTIIIKEIVCQTIPNAFRLNVNCSDSS